MCLEVHDDDNGAVLQIDTQTMHLCFTPDSKLTFSINFSHHSFPRLFGRISRIFMTICGQDVV